MDSLATFVGRREELQSLSAAIRECSELHEPRHVLIEGPPGIGKTTLLNQAVGMVPAWRRVNVYLDAGDRGRAGFTARQLLRKPQRRRAPRDREGLQALVQATADSIEAPIVVAVEDFQWVDTMSADIIFEVVRDVEAVPMFNPVTMRSSERAELRRFSRLADTKAETVHCVLAPFTMEEIRDILQEATGLPAGMAVARRVLKATDGFPQFVAGVVAWLQAAPPGEGRNIEQALASIHAPQGPVETYQQVVADVLDEYGPTTRRVIALMSLATQPMALVQVAQALDIPEVNVDELFDTALVTTVSGRVRVQYGITMRAVQSLLTPAERVDLHTRLADRGGSRRNVLVHQAELADLTATSPVTDALVTELTAVARDARGRQDLLTAVTFAQAAFRVRPEEPTAALLTRTAVKARRTDLLADHHGLLELLPHGMARSAALGRIHVEAGRVDEAFREMESAGTVRTSDTEVLTAFAEALADLSAVAALRGLLGRAASLLKRTDELLSVHESILDGDARAAVRSLREESAAADLTNVRALLRTWCAMAAEGPGILTDSSSLFSKDLATLESIPGTTSGRAVMLAARGPESRRIGRFPGALADLDFVDNHAEWIHPAIAMYGRAQLAYARFDAGLWDAAFNVGHRAASEALLSFEGAAATVAYSAAALVPLARGETGAYREVMEILNSVSESHSPTARISRHYVLAWEAIGAGEHDRVREELWAMHHSGQWWRGVITSWVLLVRASVFSGRPQGVEMALQEAESNRTTTEEVRGYACEHIRGLSELGVGRAETALKHLHQALAIISELPPATARMPHGEGGGLRIFRALLAMDIAQAVLQQPAPVAEHHQRAAELITWAEAVWVSCGATGLARQTRRAAESLRRQVGPSVSAPDKTADGQLPRTLSVEGRRALSRLTARERQIALLVADGRTNRDVAQELVLSVRTVEYHVANALSKLTLKSKRDLQRLIVSSGWGATN